MKSYLITDPSFYSDLNSFRAYLEKLFSGYHPDFVCFRDKISPDPAFYAKTFLQIARKHNISHILINQYLDLAKELDFDGIHLTSAQIDLIVPAKQNGLYVVASTHSLEEAQRAKTCGADAVTISPVFATPGKGVPKGINYLQDFVRQLHDIHIFALGGIVNQKEINAVQKTGVYGFASIRYFI